MDDNKIITPGASDVKDLMDAGTPEDGEELTRQQRRLQERQAAKDKAAFEQVMKKPARIAHFVALERSFKQLAGSLSETDVSFLALVELMEEKGLLSKEEVMEKEQEVFERLNRKKSTPNSPALDEAKDAAKDGKVERLDEVPPTVQEDDENASRRIVES